MCVKVLRRQGVQADLFGVTKVAEIDASLADNPTCTHCVIQAVWIPSDDLSALIAKYPRVHFVVRVHSQIAFLQVEPGAITIIREMMSLQEWSTNLTLSANSKRLSRFLEDAYSGNVLYLPNLFYDVMDSPQTWRPPYVKDTLKIASFGACRLMKNHLTAAAVAIEVSRALNVHLKFHISVNRDDNGKSVVAAITNLISGLKYADLVTIPWEPWPEFRRTIRSMDLAIQLSMSETFNIVSADAAAGYVPSVVSDAIEWAPKDWMASIDDVQDAAKTGIWLLSNQRSGQDGRSSLLNYNDDAIRIWMGYLESNPTN